MRTENEVRALIEKLDPRKIDQSNLNDIKYGFLNGFVSALDWMIDFEASGMKDMAEEVLQAMFNEAELYKKGDLDED